MNEEVWEPTSPAILWNEPTINYFFVQILSVFMFLESRICKLINGTGCFTGPMTFKFAHIADEVFLFPGASQTHGKIDAMVALPSNRTLWNTKLRQPWKNFLLENIMFRPKLTASGVWSMVSIYQIFDFYSRQDHRELEMFCCMCTIYVRPKSRQYLTNT